MMTKETGIGLTFVIGALVFVSVVGAELAHLPTAGLLDIPAGTVLHGPAGFCFEVGAEGGNLTGAWKSDSPESVGVWFVGTCSGYNPGGSPKGSLNGLLTPSLAGQLNLSLAPGIYGLDFLSSATATVTQTIRVAPR